MKKIFLLACLLPALTGLTQAQTFRFYYYDDSLVINSNFSSGIESSNEPGFSKVLITGANITKFKNTATPNLVAFYNKMNTVSSPLRKAVNRLTAISNGVVTTITFNLANDSIGLPASNTENEFCRRYNGSLMADAAWPCAINQGATGEVWFGETAAGRRDFEGVVLHELSHTQTRRDSSRLDSRYGLKSGVLISYGGDQGHYVNELLGDQQSAMDEAFGNFWRGIYDTVWQHYVMSSLGNNDDYFLGSHSLLTGTPEMWNAPNIKLIDTSIRTTSVLHQVNFEVGGYRITLADSILPPMKRYIARLYKFCNVPAKFLFNSELMTEIYLHYFHDYAYQVRDSSLNTINRFARYYDMPTPYQKHRYPPSMAMFLAADLEAYGRRTARHPVGERMVSSVFAIGLYDLMTHFGSTDAELTRVFNIATYNMDGLPMITKSKAFQNYFTIRNDLKAAVMPGLYNGGDCSTTPSLNMTGAVAALKAYCQRAETIALTK